MTFWKKLQLLGSVLSLAVAGLTIGTAFLVRPETLHEVAPPPLVKPPHPGLGELANTTGL